MTTRSAVRGITAPTQGVDPTAQVAKNVDLEVSASIPDASTRRVGLATTARMQVGARATHAHPSTSTDRRRTTQAFK